jgi:hypothetical protein
VEGSSGTLVLVYQTVRCHVPEDCDLVLVFGLWNTQSSSDSTGCGGCELLGCNRHMARFVVTDKAISWQSQYTSVGTRLTMFSRSGKCANLMILGTIIVCLGLK